jgi:hypothetical protein
VVTWNSPASGSTVTLPLNSASSTALSATSAAGKSITYTANALPTGLSIVSSAVTGTPTVTANTTSLFTATAATDGKTTTATINWVVSVAVDPYFNSVTLLLSASTPTSNFIADASVNTFAIAPSGSGTPSANTNNPLQPGYYSGSFNGSSNLAVPSSTAFNFGTGDFTIESWVYPIALGTAAGESHFPIVGSDGSFSPNVSVNWLFEYLTTGGNHLRLVSYEANTGYTIDSNIVTLAFNTWSHVACVRVSGIVTFYINGISHGGGSYTRNFSITQGLYVGVMYGGGPTPYTVVWYSTMYASNLRIVKGIGVYTGNFTPPTAPLQATQSAGTNIAAITGTATSLLTCQSYRFIDNSSTPQTITAYGTTSISVTQPFTLPSPYTGYGAGLFNGSSSDYLTIPANTAFVFGTGDFTMEAWVYATALPTAPTGTIMANGGNSNVTTNYSVIFYLSTTLYPSLYVGTSTTQSVGITSSSAIVINTWNHISVTRSGITFTIWLNGVPVASGTSSVNLNTSQDLYISRTYSDLANRYLTGYISNARIVKGTAVYTGAFTPPTLAPLTNAGATSAAAYPSTTNVDITFASSATSLLTLQNNQAQNNNQFRDSSTNNFAITRTGTPTQGTFTPFSQTGWSGYFGAIGNKLSVPAGTPFAYGTGAFTVEAWVNPYSYQIGTYAGGIIFSQATNGQNYFMYFVGGSGEAVFTFGSGGGTSITTAAGLVPLNTWTHVALVRSGTGTNQTKIYVNGTSYVTSTCAWDFTDVSYSPTIATYTHDASSVPYAGYISNIRVVKGVAVYAGNFTPPTAPLTATQAAGTNIAAITGTATSLLTLQDNRFKDNALTPNTITVSGTPSIQAFSPFAPTTTYSASAVGGSMYFNGSSDYVSIPKNTALEPATSGAWTIECFFYTTSTSYQEIWTYGNSTISAGSDLGTYISFSGSGTATGGFYSGGTGVVVQGGTVTLNQWNHQALVSNGTTMTLYLNGISVGTPLTITGTSINTPSSATGRIGQYNSGAAQYFNGYISNFRFVKGTAVYTGAFTPPTAPLTATQTSGTNIAAITSGTSLLMSATNAGIYDSTGKNDLTTVGDARTSTAVIKYGSSSMYFDGTGDYVTEPTNVNFGYGTGDFTIEFWLYLNALGIQTIFSNLSADASVNPHIYYSSGLLYFTNSANRITGSTLSTATWYHIAVCRASSSTKMFINGTQSGSTYADTNNYGTTAPLGIGTYWVSGTPSSANTLNGYITDLRITKGIARYTTTFTPPTAPFTGQ